MVIRRISGSEGPTGISGSAGLDVTRCTASNERRICENSGMRTVTTALRALSVGPTDTPTSASPLPSRNEKVIHDASQSIRHTPLHVMRTDASPPASEKFIDVPAPSASAISSTGRSSVFEEQPNRTAATQATATAQINSLFMNNRFYRCKT